MSDTTIIKVDGSRSPSGSMGQVYLAAGTTMEMRLWDRRPPSDPDPEVQRDYDTVGYVIDGRAELHSEGQTVILAPGDSWVVPRGATHSYRILETFTAVEATHPPASIHGRDERP